MSVRLQIDDVAWQVGGRAILAGVSLEVRAHEVVVVMGLNGAGKSTLLDIVAGLRRPTRGTVRLNDRPSAEWDARARARRRSSQVSSC